MGKKEGMIDMTAPVEEATPETTEVPDTTAPAEGTGEGTAAPQEDGTQNGESVTTTEGSAAADAKPEKPETPGLPTWPMQIGMLVSELPKGTVAYLITRVEIAFKPALDARRLFVRKAAVEGWTAGSRITLRHANSTKASFGTWRIDRIYTDGVASSGVKNPLDSKRQPFPVDESKRYNLFRLDQDPDGLTRGDVDTIRAAAGAAARAELRAAKEAEAAAAAQAQDAPAEATPSQDEQAVVLETQLEASLEALGVDPAEAAAEAEELVDAEIVLDDEDDDGEPQDADDPDADDADDDDPADDAEPQPDDVVSAADVRGRHSQRNRGRNAA